MYLYDYDIVNVIENDNFIHFINLINFIIINVNHSIIFIMINMNLLNNSHMMMMNNYNLQIFMYYHSLFNTIIIIFNYSLCLYVISYVNNF